MPKKSTFDATIHSVYRLARVTAGASLRAVAKKAGINHVQLHHIEHSKKPMSAAQQDRWNTAIETLKGKPRK